jgi:hypothetical protein
MKPYARFSPFGRVLVVVAAVVLILASNVSAANWKEKVLYSFQGGATDGSLPAGGVVFDSQGKLYGATTHGGPASCTPIGSACGMVFELSPPAQEGNAWTETLIYQFHGEGSKDASVPTGGLIFDTAGNLYGVTAYGGTGNCVLVGIKAGCGTVFELSPPQQKGGAWTETILYSFLSGNDGYFPWGNLTFDNEGTIYGATQFGGGKGTTCNIIYGGQCGTVFKLSSPKQKGGKWTEKVLHRFKSGTDGANPTGGLVLDSKGSIYGTTFGGGNENGECGSLGCGTVFELKPPSKKGSTWTEKVLYRFSGQNGANPNGDLIFDTKGTLYGTAQGGPNNEGDGVAFRLTAIDSTRWRERVLHVFSRNDSGGAGPLGGLISDGHGGLYGTASWSHVSSGDVFRIAPPSRKGSAWTLGVLYGFTGPPDGATPGAGLVPDKYGNLYGTTQMGGTGTCGCGTVFEVKK